MNTGSDIGIAIVLAVIGVSGLIGMGLAMIVDWRKR